MLLVTTEDNWTYGLDPETGAVKWSRQIGTAWNAADIGCADLSPHVGVTGTPVIDSTGSGTAYLAAKSYVSGTSGAARYDMHAIDLATGAEKPGYPVRIQGAGQNNAGLHLQRASTSCSGPRSCSSTASSTRPSAATATTRPTRAGSPE